MAKQGLMYLLLLFALVVVVTNSQAYPQFEFGRRVLPNKSYIVREHIGEGVGNSLRCVTNYSDCCSGSGSGMGNWYDEQGMEVHQGAAGGYFSDLYVTRGEGVVYLKRRHGGQSGMLRCDIPDTTGTTQSIYIYTGTTRSGSLTSANISFTLDTEPNESPPEFTLTCRSEGGPATTVLWEREGVTVQEDSDHETSQIIVDTSRNAVYENRLRVRGRREGGNYKCTVSNNFRSIISTNILLRVARAPTQLTAIYKSATSILLAWTFEVEEQITTGYTYVIYYQSEGDSGDVSVSSGETRTHLLTGLQSGVAYIISIVAVIHIPSPVVGPVTAIIEPPKVDVSGYGSGVTGTSYTLICRVTLPSGVQLEDSATPTIQWLRPDTSTLTPVGPTLMNDGAYTSNVTLNPLQETHTGQYMCEAGYSLGGLSSPQVDDSITVFSLTAPVVSVGHSGSAVNGSTDYVLFCTLTIPPLTGIIFTLRVNILWRYPSGKVQNFPRTEIPTDGDDLKFFSRLSLSPLTHDDEGDYTCTANYTVVGVRSPVTSWTYQVMITRVMITDITNVTKETAMIWWTVSYIAYSPEMYIVKYGTSQDSLTENSDPTYSGEDTTITNKTYSIKLSNLKESTTYYVQVVATNTANRTNLGSVESFTTSEMESDQREEEDGEGTEFPVGMAIAIVAVFVVIAAVVAISVVLFIRYKQQRKSVHKKYSFPGENTTGTRDTVDKDSESEKAKCDEKAEEIELESLQIETVPPQDSVEEEVDEYYFHDSTTIVPGFDSIPIEEFPEYVQDMVQNKGSKMKAEFMALSQLSQPPCTVAALPCNKPHNRFNNIHPYDKSRVCLMETTGVEGSDYINASFIDGYGEKNNAYIAAQGPVEASVERFWSMVWQYKLQTIVMLTECVEAGKVKCVRYWPEQLHDSVTLGSQFHVTSTSTQAYAEFEIRKLKLKNLVEADSRPMTITQLHYTAWPDHGVPDNVMSLIGFIRHVRKVHPVSQQQPLLVHCSAGVGRTGTLILLDIIMQQMKAEGSISVHQWLRNMRMQRMKMVQSLQQYEFIHCGLRELVVCGETEATAANLRITINNLEKMTEDGTTGFQKQLKILDEVCSQQPVSCADAEKEYNSSKNRFPDKLPNNMYRVRLRPGPLPGSDYINASFVNGYKVRGAFIATQGPLKNTVVDFWRMINEFQCGCIVMLCELQEDGQESSYCFWPKEEGDLEAHGKLTAKLLSVKYYGDIIIRKLEVVEGAVQLNKQQIVTVLQLTSWPMKGLPHPTAVISLIDRLTNTQMRSSTRRTVVICSDGVRRTGTFLTIHSQVERLKTEGVVDFLQSIKSARLQRAGLVLDVDHYAFCHEVLNTYLDNFDTYSNFKEVI